jgi:DNA-directed RNA polymerase subunit RPC12/RpoP
MSPSKATLQRYGITEEEWQVLYDKYDGTCHICRKPAARLNVEHEHVRGWKQMPPDERKQYIRGLACFVCNHRILTRGVTIEKLRNAVRYLEEYEQRKIP